MICPRCSLDNQPGITACARCDLPAPRPAAPGQSPAEPSAPPAAPSPRPEQDTGSAAARPTPTSRWWTSDSSDEDDLPAESSPDPRLDEQTTVISRGEALSAGGQPRLGDRRLPRPCHGPRNLQRESSSTRLRRRRSTRLPRRLINLRRETALSGCPAGAVCDSTAAALRESATAVRLPAAYVRRRRVPKHCLACHDAGHQDVNDRWLGGGHPVRCWPSRHCSAWLLPRGLSRPVAVCSPSSPTAAASAPTMPGPATGSTRSSSSSPEFWRSLLSCCGSSVEPVARRGGALDLGGLALSGLGVVVVVVGLVLAGRVADAGSTVEQGDQGVLSCLVLGAGFVVLSIGLLLGIFATGGNADRAIAARLVSRAAGPPARPHPAETCVTRLLCDVERSERAWRGRRRRPALTPQPRPLRPSVIAHRGSSAVVAEHTLGAYVRALEDGADGLECDVRPSGGRPPDLHARPAGRPDQRRARGSCPPSSWRGLKQLDWASWKTGWKVRRRGSHRRRGTGSGRGTARCLLTLERLCELVRDAGAIRSTSPSKPNTRPVRGPVERRLVELLDRFSWATASPRSSAVARRGRGPRGSASAGAWRWHRRCRPSS